MTKYEQYLVLQIGNQTFFIKRVKVKQEKKKVTSQVEQRYIDTKPTGGN